MSPRCRDLRVRLTLLAVVAACGPWGCAGQPPIEAGGPAQSSRAPGGAGVEPSPAVEDPARIVAPTPVDLTTEPGWARDPFAAVREPVAPEPAPAVAATPAPLPVVQTILFSPGRNVALVDGRIVKPGDRVGEGRVAEIGRDAVVVESPDGRRTSLALRRPPDGQKRR